jgi:hypothetical protein
LADSILQTASIALWVAELMAEAVTSLDDFNELAGLGLAVRVTLIE